MSNRTIKRKVIVDYFNYFLSEFEGTLRNNNKMRKQLEYARDKFASENL